MVILEHRYKDSMGQWTIMFDKTLFSFLKSVWRLIGEGEGK